ncbi:MAG: cytochrome b N-terminal domain-containing protein [Gemmatimonadetes bacterium]|nr:cytochrome b N-terminal domain-containing protein [Gemmatimonadota bacterium]
MHGQDAEHEPAGPVHMARPGGPGSVVAERLALSALSYEIPAQAQRWPFMLGGLTACSLVVLIVTGVYLAQFYNPSPAGAHDSMLYIMTRAPLGDWVRSLHSWSAAAVVLTLVLHLVVVFRRRAYRRPREVTWWAGVGLAALVFMLIITGTVLRYDQEGYEALAHFVAGGKLMGAFGRFFTDSFTLSTSLLSRMFSLHTSFLPLVLIALIALHFWLIRHLGIRSDDDRVSVFRRHAVRLTGFALLGFAVVGVLAAIGPEDLGAAPVPGLEVTKPFWPVLWVYGLENLLGAWGMVIGPLALFAFLALVPLVDRGTREKHGWVGWMGLLLGAAVLALWLYGALGEAQQHIM